ncbi:MAG: hypothetical protein J1F31_06990 [Erysipelotrichales bacterium]|nr:hypothetical protein [Erysipelotrichales bacterium]
MNIKNIFKLVLKIILIVLIVLFLYFNFALVILLLLIVAFFIYSIYLYFKLYNALLLNKTTIRIVFIALLFWWLKNWGATFKQDFINTFYSFEDFLINIGTFLIGIDIVVWIEIKFLEQFSSIRKKKELDTNNPKRLISEIESLVNEQIFNENPDIKKLYDILQISALSIKTQKEIIRTNFMKNMLISFLFFVLGLIIPKIISFFI